MQLPETLEQLGLEQEDLWEILQQGPGDESEGLTRLLAAVEALLVGG